MKKLFTKIISNLLSNALKYAKSTIRITTIEKDSEIVVTVTDDGIGITDQEKTKIFDAFYQVKNNSEINKLGIGYRASHDTLTRPIDERKDRSQR